MAENNEVETRVGSESVRSIELGMPLEKGQTKPTVKSSTSEGQTAEFDGDRVTTHTSDKDPKDGQEGTTPQEDGGDGNGEGQEGQEGQAEALPDFNPDSPEVVAAYDDAFLNKDTGEPNLEALSGEWFKSAKKDAKGNWEGSLPESAYAYLETKGYSKEMVKSVEAGQVALLQQQEQAVYSRAGGPDRLQKALDWARKGGYSDAQKERYNATVVQGRDRELAGEQIDLLMTRFDQASGNARRQRGPQTRVAPNRSVAANAGTSGPGVGGAKPYANRAEWQADVRKAREDNNQGLLDDSRKRLKASPWYTGG